MMHAFNSETLTPEADWSKPVPAIQSVIHHSPSRRLGGRTPITVHTGMPSGKPLTVVLTDCNIQGVESIDQARLQQKLGTDELLESLDKMHKDVVTSTRLHTFYHTVIPSLSNLVHFI